MAQPLDNKMYTWYLVKPQLMSRTHHVVRRTIFCCPLSFIANWIAGQHYYYFRLNNTLGSLIRGEPHHLRKFSRQQIRQKKITNIIHLTKKEAELQQQLDQKFNMRIAIEATRNIISMQQNVANAVSNNNDNEMDHQRRSHQIKGIGEDSDNSYCSHIGTEL